MQTKEFYCHHDFLQEGFLFPAFTEDKYKNIKNRIYKFNCFLLKKAFRAKKVVIDYRQKVAYLQYEHSSPIEDDRLYTANSRIVEVHYHNLKALFISLLKGNPM